MSQGLYFPSTTYLATVFVVCVTGLVILALVLPIHTKARFWQTSVAAIFLSLSGAAYWFPHCEPIEKLHALRWDMTRENIIGI